MTYPIAHYYNPDTRKFTVCLIKAGKAAVQASHEDYAQANHMFERQLILWDPASEEESK